MYISDRLEKAFEDKIPDFENALIHRLVTMAVSNIIINMIVPRIESENKDRRELVMIKFLEDLKYITFSLYKEAEILIKNETKH